MTCASALPERPIKVKLPVLLFRLPLLAVFYTTSLPAYADVGDAVEGGLMLTGMAVAATMLAIVVMLLDMKKLFDSFAAWA